MTQRIRDPQRGEKILSAAAGLFAEKGYHAVSIAEIGERAGITGSGIYRHFDSKAAMLTKLFEQVIDDLLDQGRHAVEQTSGLLAALEELIRGQVAFVVNNRQLAQIYHNEIANLPDEDQVRLRRKQRLYVEEWVHLLGELDGNDEARTRTRVHIAIGAIQSVLFHQLALSPEDTTAVLVDAAHAVLGMGPAGFCDATSV